MVSARTIAENYTETEFMTDRQQDANGLDGANDPIALAAQQTTVAAFSPNQTTATHRRTQSSVLIHQKSALLLATPPQVTRALAYSHPFLLPLSHVVGLLSWSTDDQWESFLLLAAFWFTVLYGDIINRFAGPLIFVASLVAGLYARRYNPLSTKARVIKKKEKTKGRVSEKKSEEQNNRKSLDEILDTLQTFTNRCSVLIEPFLSLTEFLSTQTTATSSTTRPALMSLFLRVLIISPVWTILSLPPLYIITTQRVVLVIGTLLLSYHSTPARVTRALLWRSRLVRALTALVTGLDFSIPAKEPAAHQLSAKKALGKQHDNSKALRFTFAIYENQRRWLGLGWTSSLMSYERQAYTDPQLNPVAEPDSFVLPETDQEGTEWRWVDGSYWHIEGVSHDGDEKSHHDDDDEGWFYFDSSWQNGRDTDGWGRYTRRRKWIRDAVLIDLAEESAAAEAAKAADTNNMRPAITNSRRSWFGRRRTSSQVPAAESAGAITTSIDASRTRDGPEDDVHTPIQFRGNRFEQDIAEGLHEGLG